MEGFQPHLGLNTVILTHNSNLYVSSIGMFIGCLKAYKTNFFIGCNTKYTGPVRCIIMEEERKNKEKWSNFSYPRLISVIFVLQSMHQDALFKPLHAPQLSPTFLGGIHFFQTPGTG